MNESIPNKFFISSLLVKFFARCKQFEIRWKNFNILISKISNTLKFFRSEIEGKVINQLTLNSIKALDMCLSSILLFEILRLRFMDSIPIAVRLVRILCVFLIGELFASFSTENSKFVSIRKFFVVVQVMS